MARLFEPTHAAGQTWAVLGGLRFLLALFVFTGHLSTALPRWFLLDQMNGVAAVDCFMLISGYSIAASLTKSAAGYGDRRFWRIYPTYLTSLVIACLPFALFGPLFTGFAGPVQSPASIWPFVGNALMLQCLVVIPLATDSPVWSLSAECVYYALAPALRRLGLRSLLCIAAASAAAYAATLLLHPLPISTTRFGIPALLLAWAWITGFVYHRVQARPWASYLLWVPALCLLPLENFMSGRFGCVTIMLGALGLQYAARIPLSVRAAKAASYLGELSYPVYLIHMPVALIVYHVLNHGDPANPANALWQFPIVAASVFGVAAAIYHGVDRPCRRYAQRRLRVPGVRPAPAKA